MGNREKWGRSTGPTGNLGKKGTTENLFRRKLLPEFSEAAVLPVVDGGDRNPETLRRLGVTSAFTDDQSDGVPFVRREPRKRSIEGIDPGDRLGIRAVVQQGISTRPEPISGNDLRVEDLPQTRRTGVTAAEDVVDDLEQVTDRDLQFFEPGVLQQSDERFLSGILGHRGVRRLASKSEDPLVVPVEQIENDVSSLFIDCFFHHD